MKTASSALIAILGGSQMYMADCYSFTLVDGTVARYTTADRDLTDSATGHVFSSKGPLFTRSKIKFHTGVQVDELDIALTATPNDTIDSAPWLQALRVGLFDGAEVQLDRAFMSTFGDTSAGLLTIFAGRIAEVDGGRLSVTLKANTHLELLTMQMPWRLYQPGCAFTLYDTRCKASRASFAVTATVGSGSTVQQCNVASLSQATGYFSQGLIKFTSGALNGKTYSIRNHVNASGIGQISPIAPFPSAPANGVSVTLYPGCDKTQATCTSKFNNLVNFGGFPYVPVPETAV